MKRQLLFLLTVFLSLQLSLAQQLMVGAAMRDITPTHENGLLPIPGIGSRSPMVDVIHPIHTRVIAYQLGKRRALMVCTETGKGPLGDVFSNELSKHTGIPVEAIFYTTTHSHACPELVFAKGFSLEEKEGDSNTHKWARMTLSKMKEAATEALANLKPVTTSIGYGESYINVNRNYPYTFEDGTHKRNLGPYLKGKVDPTLVVIRFDDEQGKPVAFIINYACHAVTMIGNTYFGGKPGVDPDFPGQISRIMEAKYPSAITMWTSGAAGDMNPFVSNQIMYPDPETGKGITAHSGEPKLRDQVAYIHYDDIKKVLRNNMKTTDVELLAYAEDKTEVPGEEKNITQSLQLLRLGDIAFIGYPGELYSSLGVYIREHSDLPYTLVFNNTWNWPNSDIMYCEDDEGIIDPGFGGNHHFKLGAIAPSLSALANRLIALSTK